MPVYLKVITNLDGKIYVFKSLQNKLSPLCTTSDLLALIHLIDCYAVIFFSELIIACNLV